MFPESQGGLALAILLTASPPHPGVDTALSLVLAASGDGYGAAVFLMDEGVHAACYLADRLAERGGAGQVRLVRCAQDAGSRSPDPAESVLEGSQADWAAMVGEARVVLHLG